MSTNPYVEALGEENPMVRRYLPIPACARLLSVLALMTAVNLGAGNMPTQQALVGPAPGPGSPDGAAGDGVSDALSVGAMVTPGQSSNDTKWFGVNQPEGVFEGPTRSQVQGIDYRYPGAALPNGLYDGSNSDAYFAAKGLTLVRLAVSQSHLQPDGDGTAFRDTDVSGIRAALDAADAAGARVYLAAWMALGPNDPDAAWIDFWLRLVTTFHDHPAVWGWEMVNEPRGWGQDHLSVSSSLPGQRRYAHLAQAWVNAVRGVDSGHWLLVPGLDSQDANSWPDRNTYLDIADPQGKFLYTAHSYWDCGKTSYAYDGCGTPTAGRDYSQPFLEWLRQRNARGLFSEYGVPSNDPRWLSTLDDFLTWIDDEPRLVGGTYWAAGVGWCGSSDTLNVEPCGGVERPQVAVLARHPTRSR